MPLIRKSNENAVKTIQDVENEFYSEIIRRLLKDIQNDHLDVVPTESQNVLRIYGHTYFEIGDVTEAIYKIFEKVNNDLLEADADFLYEERDETIKIIEKLLKSK